MTNDASHRDAFGPFCASFDPMNNRERLPVVIPVGESAAMMRVVLFFRATGKLRDGSQVIGDVRVPVR